MAQAKLGKGLSALMEEEYASGLTPVAEGALTEIDINIVQSGKYQPRRSFDEGELGELAASIAQNGIMQPIVVRKISENAAVQYEIVAGERRWRASKRIGLKTIPAIIRELTDQQALELALVENVQRENLSALEEAAGYQQLIEEFGYTQEQLAGAVGKSRSHIANLLRLLGLPEEVKQMLDKGELTMGHARALMTAENAIDLAKLVVTEELNVRQAERLARGESLESIQTPTISGGGLTGAANDDSHASSAAEKNARTPRTPVAGGESSRMASSKEKNEDIIALENSLSESIGVKVQINDFGQQSGEVVLMYSSLNELDKILRRISISV